MLSYKILGRRLLDSQLEAVDVEWSSPALPAPVPDQINVSPGTSVEGIVMILESKRPRLAENLGIEP